MRSRTVQPLKQRTQKNESKQNRRSSAARPRSRVVQSQGNLVRISYSKESRPSRAAQPVARSGQQIQPGLTARKKKRGIWARVFVQDAQYFDYDLLLVLVFLMCFGCSLKVFY